jgi:hypothetical protein
MLLSSWKLKQLSKYQSLWIIKNDLTFDELIFCLWQSNKQIYYSQSVLQMLESQDHSIEVDLFDKQIFLFS